METVVLEETTSTNSVAMQAAEKGAAQGTAFQALMQSAGRGRLGKSWFSRRGDGLYVSYILRPQVAVEELAKITLVAGRAVAAVLERLVRPGCRVELKWPNDVLIGGRKVSGILTEAAPLAPEPWVVVGIGVNVHQQRQDFPEELQQMATSLAQECNEPPELSSLLERIRKELLVQTSRFEQGGFAEILEEWCQYDCLKGREMECVAVDGAVIRGVAQGPDKEGILHLRDRNGVDHEILTGDVSLAGGRRPR